MVNPFDLRGPQFLVFYACLGVTVTLVAFWLRRAGERGNPPGPLADYLEIAFLRGGADEAVRVAILTLVDRGVLLLSGGDTVSADRDDAARRVTRPTERAILTRAAHGSKAADVLGDKSVKEAARSECEPPLVRRGLLPNREQRERRRYLLLIAGGALVAVAAIKIALAIARGRSNVLLLVVFGVVFVGIALAVTHPPRTPAGNALVGDLRTLFGGLKDRAGSLQPGHGGSDFALLAAVFGVGAALPLYPDARKLFPQPSSSSDGGSSDGGSSSCGSSCGGGGGGCGGCGSS
jgi:uncharacterized protein (TIGR04222 family)